jgi:23S rRNA pseudouridine1911/1915/1917 synthase
MSEETGPDDGESGEDVVLLEAGEDAAGARIDRWLAGQCPDISRTRLKQLILEGAVVMNGKPCTDPSKKLKAGAALAVIVPPPLDDAPVPENIPLSIVYEDNDLLVIDKPAGLVVHPAPGHRTGTLVNALLHHCGASLSGIGGVRRPGIVHRLDKDTSGLMLVAKNDRAHAGLSAQLADRTLSRIYSALVWGVPSPRKGTVKTSIGRHSTQRLKMAANVKQGRAAATHYEIREAYGHAAALLECRLETGRTHQVRVHQVRVHMSFLGFPLVGDPVYGKQKTGAESLLKKDGYEAHARASILAFPRQALHARQISFIHPASGDSLTFEAALPSDLAGLINLFKNN